MESDVRTYWRLFDWTIQCWLRAQTYRFMFTKDLVTSWRATFKLSYFCQHQLDLACLCYPWNVPKRSQHARTISIMVGLYLNVESISARPHVYSPSLIWIFYCLPNTIEKIPIFQIFIGKSLLKFSLMSTVTCHGWSSFGSRITDHASSWPQIRVSLPIRRSISSSSPWPTPNSLYLYWGKAFLPLHFTSVDRKIAMLDTHTPIVVSTFLTLRSILALDLCKSTKILLTDLRECMQNHGALKVKHPCESTYVSLRLGLSINCPRCPTPNT